MIKPKALFKTVTENVPAGVTQDITLSVPKGAVWRIAQISTTLAANATLNSIKLDGTPLLEKADVNLVTQYGEALAVEESIVLNVTNGAAGPEDETFLIEGYVLSA